MINKLREYFCFKKVKLRQNNKRIVVVKSKNVRNYNKNHMDIKQILLFDWIRYFIFS